VSEAATVSLMRHCGKALSEGIKRSSTRVIAEVANGPLFAVSGRNDMAAQPVVCSRCERNARVYAHKDDGGTLTRRC
jgi:hypothetical protein